VYQLNASSVFQQATQLRESISLSQENPLSNSLEKAYDAIVEALVHAVELRDRDTASHCIRSTSPAIQLGLALKLGETEISELRWGLLLHDFGKLGVPDAILLKPGSLTAEEWIIMRKHPEFGYQTLSKLNFPREVIDICYCHHENWDGCGYPGGIKGKNIPLLARIASVAECWDSLTSNQPFRWAWSKTDAASFLQEQAGKMYDPQIVSILLEFVRDENGNL